MSSGIGRSDKLHYEMTKTGEWIEEKRFHQPFSDYYEAYRALEDLYKEGKIRAIGVSNFYPDRLVDISLFERKVIPAINQIEINPLNQRNEDKVVADKYGVKLMAWAPFGEGKNNMFANEVLVSIGKKYNKSSAQVILRWLIQRDIIIACKSTHEERIKQNFEIFDFELNDEDMNKIKELNNNNSLFFSHQDPNMVEWFSNMVLTRRKKQDVTKEKKNW